MDEYTPTTDKIRFEFLYGGETTGITQAEFDRWLAEHDREVRAEAVAVTEAALRRAGSAILECKVYGNPLVDAETLAFAALRSQAND